MTGTLDADESVPSRQVILADPDRGDERSGRARSGGWLPFGGSEVIPFYLNEADAAVDAIILTAFPQIVRVRLRAPSGQVLDQTHPSMTWTQGVRMGFYRFTLPVPGAWSAEGPGAGRSCWTGSAGRTAHGSNAPRACDRHRVCLNGRFATTRSSTRAGSRNGGERHQDRSRHRCEGRCTTRGSANTGRFPWTARGCSRTSDTRTAGRRSSGSRREARACTTASACLRHRRLRDPASTRRATLRGFPFTREAVRTAAVWQGGDAPPPTGHDDGWCAVVRCLLETKAIDLEVLKRYGIHPDRLSEVLRDG